VNTVSDALLKLLASGGNDNVVNVWDGRNPSTPRMTKNNHTAAVKALAWAPWQSSLLASGGGTNDKVRRGLALWEADQMLYLHRPFISGTPPLQPDSIRWSPILK
jgi:cell division cycle protein 20 (cofactor of APC complex)